MTSIDDQITADLAIVGRASRERPRSVDATLRAVRAQPTAAPGRERTDLSLLALARVFASRVARIATSVQIVVFLVPVFVAVATTGDELPDGNGSLLIVLLETLQRNLGTYTVGVATILHVVAWHSAATSFERSIAAASDPLARARQLVARVDGWSTVLVIAAAMGLVLVFGMISVVGIDRLAEFRQPDTAAWIDTLRRWTRWSLALTTLASLVGAAMIARSLQRDWVPRRWLVGAAILVLAVTVYVGLRLDVGPMRTTLQLRVTPDYVLRTTLLVTGTLSLFTLVASYALARRRREHAAIRGTP